MSGSTGFLGELSRVLQHHLQAISGTGEDGPEPDWVRGHLYERLTELGLSDDAATAICSVFDDHATQLAEMRAEYGEVEEQLNRLRSSSARRIGRVTRRTSEVINGQFAIGLFIDESDFMLMPPLSAASPPQVGETVQFARGDDGDAIYFGSCGVDPGGLVTGTYRRSETTEDGRAYVEVALRESGDPSDTVVAVASEQLQSALPRLEPGARVRVTDGRVRIAFTAPQPDPEAQRRANPLYTIYDPLSAAEDNFVYPREVLERLDQIVEIIRSPERAHEYKLRVPGAVAFEGPSGTGKTTIAERYLSRSLRDLGFLTLRIHPDRVTSQWYGQSEKLMREALDAGGDQNTLIVFNEVDSLMPKRNGSQLSSTAEVSSRIFAVVAEIIGRPRQPGDPIRLIAFTTNYVSRLDPALRSRLDAVISVGLPSRETAVQIAAGYLTGMRLEEEPALVARMALCALEMPLVRLVFDSSDKSRTYQARELLSGRTIELAVQACARDAFQQRSGLSPFSLSRELKRQLYGTVVDMRQEDLIVALGLPVEEARRVTDMHVFEEALAEDCTPRGLRMRFRSAS